MGRELSIHDTNMCVRAKGHDQALNQVPANMAQTSNDQNGGGVSFSRHDIGGGEAGQRGRDGRVDGWTSYLPTMKREK